MNKESFIKLTQGNFGRKIAVVDVDEVTLDNVVKICAIGVSAMNYNSPMFKYLYTYYKGDQPVLWREKRVRPEINNKVCENHALETVRFKAGQTFGEPIQYVGKKKNANEETNEYIDRLNDYMDNAHADARNVKLGIMQSAVGTAYKAVQANKKWKDGSKQPPFHIVVPDVNNTVIVYSSITEKALLSVQRMKDLDNNQYFECYSDTMWFKIQNSKVVDYSRNFFDAIPIVEYPNNADRLSDIEITITMFDTINNMQSERMNGIEQFVQALMKFKNCEIDENKFLEMVQLGAVVVKDVGSGLQSDVEMMTAELNQSESQVSKNDIYQNILIIQGMPDRQQNSGGDTGQAVYLRNGWDFAEQRAKLDEPFTKESESNFANVILNVISKTSKDVNLSVNDFEIRISRGSTDNLLVKAQALDYLFKNKIHPLIALITCGMFPDPQKVYEMSLPYLGSIYPELIESGDAQMQEAQKLLENQKALNGADE